MGNRASRIGGYDKNTTPAEKKTQRSDEIRSTSSGRCRVKPTLTRRLGDTWYEHRVSTVLAGFEPTREKGTLKDVVKGERMARGKWMGAMVEDHIEKHRRPWGSVFCLRVRTSRHR